MTNLPDSHSPGPEGFNLDRLVTRNAQLIDAIAHRKCILFLGSGFSKHTHGLPIWNELVTDIYRQFNQTKNVPTDVLDYKLEYLDHLKTRHGAALCDHLKRLLLTEDPPSETELLLCRLPWAAIVTTNLDDRIEQTFQYLGEDCVLVDSETDISSVGQANGVLLLKMHGSLAETKNAVLSFTDYQDFDLDRHAMKAMVVSLFSQYPALIIGAGLSDPNFRKISEIVNVALQGFRQRCYYVSEEVPWFVKDVWEKRNFEFLKVPNKNLDSWIKALYESVERVKPHTRDTIAAFSKRNALIEMSKTTEDYEQLQERYLASIHIPDYTLFSGPWEKTLYTPLRKRLMKALRGRPTSNFAYIAPGPHAPLFSGDGWLNLTPYVKQISLFDVSQTVLADCLRNLSNLGVPVSSTVCDITQGLGLAFGTQLSQRLKASRTLDQLATSIGELRRRFDELLPQCRDSAQDLGNELIGNFDVVYSEMVVSFTGTASIMAFDTSVRLEFSKELQQADQTERLSAINEDLLRLWQHYNDRVYNVHLDFMSKLAASSGTIIIATDVEKRFDDPSIPGINSFSSPELPKYVPVALVRRESEERSFFWRDHRFNFPTRIGATDVNYFLAHTHRIAVAEYSKMAA